MSRRPGRCARRMLLPAFRTYYTDPFVKLGADRAWRADDATDDGSVTTGLPNYIGAALTLTRQGTGQSIKATSANLGGKRTIAVNGSDAAGGYGAVALAGAPAAFTIVMVCYLAAVANQGLSALTVGGTVVTGVTQHRVTTIRSSKTTADATSAFTAPGPLILASVFVSAGIKHYATRYTSVDVASAGALAGTTFHVMCRSANASSPLTMTGEWRKTAYFARALSASEVAFALRMLGREHNVAIAA
jgi:hypothetical protein